MSRWRENTPLPSPIFIYTHTRMHAFTRTHTEQGGRGQEKRTSPQGKQGSCDSADVFDFKPTLMFLYIHLKMLVQVSVFQIKIMAISYNLNPLNSNLE